MKINFYCYFAKKEIYPLFSRRFQLYIFFIAKSIKILKYTYIVFRAHTRARILGFTRAYAPGLAAETPLESAPRLRIRPPLPF